MRKFRRIALLLVIALADAAVIYYGIHLRQNPQNPLAGPTVVTTPETPSLVSNADVKLDRAALHVAAGESLPTPLMTAWSDRAVWRAVGYCGQQNALISTNNFGSRWYVPHQPSPFVIWLHRTGADSGWVMGSEASCTTVTRYSTNDDGLHWTAAKHLGHVWIPTPVGIRTPSGSVTRPCGKKHPAPISFTSEGVAGDAMVICQQGVLRTTDGGDTWVPVGDVSDGDAAAVALTKDGTGVLAMVNEKTCLGARMLNTIDGGATWTVGECLRVANPPVAVSIGDAGGGMLLSLGSRYLTTDYGKTWD